MTGSPKVVFKGLFASQHFLSCLGKGNMRQFGMRTRVWLERKKRTLQSLAYIFPCHQWALHHSLGRVPAVGCAEIIRCQKNGAAHSMFFQNRICIVQIIPVAVVKSDNNGFGTNRGAFHHVMVYYIQINGLVTNSLQVGHLFLKALRPDTRGRGAIVDGVIHQDRDANHEKMPMVNFPCVEKPSKSAVCGQPWYYKIIDWRCHGALSVQL